MLRNIRERFAKVQIVAPEPQATIYQQLRADIAYLLGYTSELERQVDALTPKEQA